MEVCMTRVGLNRGTELRAEVVRALDAALYLSNRGMRFDLCEPSDSYRWITFQNGRTIISNVDGHGKLLAIANFGLSDGLVKWFEKYLINSNYAVEMITKTLRPIVVAAGDVSHAGTIKWRSMCLDLETPESLRPEIAPVIIAAINKGGSQRTN